VIGVALAGAGARGAYEAGVLSVLLPAMEEADERPTVWIGTSAGAINAALFASLAHLPAKEAADRALESWRRLRRSDVYRLSPGLFTALLDTRPLRGTLDTMLDWNQLHLNTGSARPVVDAVAVAATTFGAYRTTVFAEGRAADPLPAADEHRGVDYHRVTLGRDHVLASAAIPVAFPAVRIGEGQAAAWYLDGGVRLNAPLKPAVELGVDRLVVVATAPLHTPPSSPAGARRPDVFDAAADVVHAALVDRMVEDVRTLAAANEQTGLPRGRVIPYMFAGPHEPGEIARLADDVLHGKRRGIGLRLLRRMLGGSALSRGELLSYLFFEPDFIDGAIALGASDAWRLLESVRGGLPWSVTPR